MSWQGVPMRTHRQYLTAEVARMDRLLAGRRVMGQKIGDPGLSEATVRRLRDLAAGELERESVPKIGGG